jgi:hypothetical protein
MDKGAHQHKGNDYRQPKHRDQLHGDIPTGVRKFGRMQVCPPMPTSKHLRLRGNWIYSRVFELPLQVGKYSDIRRSFGRPCSTWQSR